MLYKALGLHPMKQPLQGRLSFKQKLPCVIGQLIIYLVECLEI